MIPVLLELYNGDILVTYDGNDFMVLSSAPLDVQSSIRVKVDGVYEAGYVWFRINEKWRKVKALYIKESGSWQPSKNVL